VQASDDSDHLKRLDTTRKEQVNQMNKKELLALGLTEELADQIVVLHGKDIEAHKSKLATAQAEVDGLKGQLTEAGTAIEGFKKLDVEGIKVAANEWKAKAEQAQADAAKQISSLKFDHALDGALVGAKAKNAKAVKALLNANDLKLAEDGSILGLKEQLEKVKSENDYLFESDNPTPKVVLGGQNKSVLSDAMTDAIRRGAGLPPLK
jgi:flagellar biosynthesis chaperone FliJ